MLYQLPNGRVIELSTEQFFQMSDEELQYYVAYNYGETVEDPWFGSVLSKEAPDDYEEIIPDLTDVPEIDKLTDLDADSVED